jgi:hypothetical protein
MKNNTNNTARLATLLIPAAAGLGALLAPPAGAVEALLAVDAYVSTSQPATNFGHAETLPVGNGNRALLRFDVASMLPAGTTSSQVSKAVLSVWVSGVSQAGSVAVSELLGSWTEPGVTEATLPGVGPAFATKAVSTAGRWVPIAVTPQVKKWLTDPTTNKGLLIAPAASAPATAVSLDSKENTATSHPARLEIELTGTLGSSHTLIVGKTAGDGTGRPLTAPDFTSISAALNSIPAGLYSRSGCSARYLVKVLPGTYAERVTMKSCVDIEGAGELTTRITAAGGANLDAASATVTGASEAELRFLTVANTGGTAYAIGLYNYQTSPRLTHVTTIASGGTEQNYGMYNYSSSSPAMTDVTATASGDNESYGVYNHSYSSPRMTNVTVTASGSGINYGVSNYNSSPTMTNVTATALGGTSANTGVYNNASSSPAMTHVTATGSGGYASIGVYNDSSSPMMTDVTATGLGGTYSYGVTANAGASPTILRSTLRGKTYSLNSGGTGTVRVSTSHLDGPVLGTAACVASSNASFQALNASCQ